MADDKDSLIEHYARMREQLFAAIAGLSDELMAEPSLDGWSVKDHLAHLALWDDIRAEEIGRISGGHQTAWRATNGEDEGYNAIAYSLRVNLAIDQARWELATSRDRLTTAITSASGRALDPSQYGEAALRSTHEAAHIGWISRWRKERGL